MLVFAAGLARPQDAYADYGGIVGGYGDPKEPGDYLYIEHDGTVALVYRGSAKSVTVPATFKGKKVTELELESTTVTSLNLGKAARNLKMLAVYGTSISKLDLSKCANLQRLYCHMNKLTKLNATLR